MKETMFHKVGIFREGSLIEQGIEKIRELRERYARAPVQNKGKVYNVDLMRGLEIEGMLDIAEAILVGAYKREESRGAHSRLDFKERDDGKFLMHTIAKYTPKGAEISYSPVKVTKYKPEARRY
jgi:succinate dehydrogenase / fumarate reductase flavoprotein subunit